MRTTQAGEVLKAEWFGRKISILLVNDKTVSGEVTEVSSSYIILDTGSGQMQIMKNSIILIRPVDNGDNAG